MAKTSDELNKELDVIADLVSSDNPYVRRQYETVDAAISRLNKYSRNANASA